MLKQIITIALSKEEYERWKKLQDKYSQHDLFIQGLELAEEVEDEKLHPRFNGQTI